MTEADVAEPLLEALARYDSPTLANAIETFGLQSRDVGFADHRIRCMFPELGRMVGYAATAFSALGAVGCVTNGSVRDLDEARGMGSPSRAWWPSAHDAAGHGLRRYGLPPAQRRPAHRSITGCLCFVAARTAARWSHVHFTAPHSPRSLRPRRRGSPRLQAPRRFSHAL